MPNETFKVSLRPKVAAYLREQAADRQQTLSGTVDQLLYDLMQGGATTQHTTASRAANPTGQSSQPAEPAPLEPVTYANGGIARGQALIKQVYGVDYGELDDEMFTLGAIAELWMGLGPKGGRAKQVREHQEGMPAYHPQISHMLGTHAEPGALERLATAELPHINTKGAKPLHELQALVRRVLATTQDVDEIVFDVRGIAHAVRGAPIEGDDGDSDE